MFNTLSGGLSFFTIAYILLVLLDILSIKKQVKVSTADVVIWLALVYLLPVVGLIIYVFVGRRRMLKGVYGDKENTKPTDLVRTQNDPEWTNTLELAKKENALSTNISQNPNTVRTITSITGSILGAIAIIAGLAVVGIIIWIAIVAYQCSRPGAKCM